MIGIFCLIWLVSTVLAISVAIQKDIKPSFWAYVFILAPIVNSYIAIIYFRVDISGFSEFWKKLNENNDRK